MRTCCTTHLHPSPEGYALLGRRFAAAAFGPTGPLA